MDGNLQFRRDYVRLIDSLSPKAQEQQRILQAVLLQLGPVCASSKAICPGHKGETDR